MVQQSSPLQRLGRYSGIAVVLSVVACYGTLALVAVLSLAGVTMSVHEGAWAAVIVALAWTAVLAMGVNIQRHRSFGPFILSDIGALLVSWVMIVDYGRVLEVIGFALLVVAALWDRQLRRRGPAPSPSSNKGS
ncbi:MAG: MerC domain-containing protein [Gammaproteobacteria bacterium]